MRKMTIMKVVELRKESEGTTKCLLGSDGIRLHRWHQAYNEGHGIDGFCLECDDAEAPELNQHLIVMVETIPDLGTEKRANWTAWTAATGDPYKSYLDKRRGEVASPQPATKPLIVSGRKFR